MAANTKSNRRNGQSVDQSRRIEWQNVTEQRQRGTPRQRSNKEQRIEIGKRILKLLYRVM